MLYRIVPLHHIKPQRAQRLAERLTRYGAQLQLDGGWLCELTNEQIKRLRELYAHLINQVVIIEPVDG